MNGSVELTAPKGGIEVALRGPKKIFRLLNPTLIKGKGGWPGGGPDPSFYPMGLKGAEKTTRIAGCDCEKYSGKGKSFCYYYFYREKLIEENRLTEGICSDLAGRKWDYFNTGLSKECFELLKRS